MGDAMKKVQSGQPLEIPAETFNTFIDAAHDFRARQQNRGQTAQPRFQQTGIVLVKNNSGANRDRFDVLGVDSPIIAPGDNLEEFKNHVALVGVVPDKDAHLGQFLVLAEPIPAGEIGRAVVSGVTVARVEINDPDCPWVDIGQGVTDRLISDPTGAAQILWADSGTGAVWVVVRLGNKRRKLVRYAKAQSDWEENAGDPRVLCKSCDRDGSNLGSQDFYVYLPRSTSGDPAIFQDTVLAYSEDADGIKVCVSDYMDDAIGTIKLWRGAIGEIPEGWRLCDGTSGAFDLAGRFPLGVDPGGRSDEDTVGDTGGHRWHGQTENNHPLHPNHRHAYDTTSDKVDAGQDGTEQAWDASPASTSWTSGVDNLQGESGEILGHYGPYNSGGDTDNRPPYRVVAFIERWK